MTPKLLDLYCGAGGAGMGYHRAGFSVVGVDSKPQPRYPFEFVQGDALDYLATYGPRFDAVHASPPCQRYTQMSVMNGMQESHPDLVAPTRSLLLTSGKPWIMENVITAPLKRTVMLCGGMFGLRVYRHRAFECSFLVMQPEHYAHKYRPVRREDLGRRPGPDQVFTVTGNFADLPGASAAMGIDWMIRRELAQAIPPAYTEYLGHQLMRAI